MNTYIYKQNHIFSNGIYDKHIKHIINKLYMKAQVGCHIYITKCRLYDDMSYIQNEVFLVKKKIIYWKKRKMNKMC